MIFFFFTSDFLLSYYRGSNTLFRDISTADINVSLQCFVPSISAFHSPGLSGGHISSSSSSLHLPKLSGSLCSSPPWRPTGSRSAASVGTELGRSVLYILYSVDGDRLSEVPSLFWDRGPTQDMDNRCQWKHGCHTKVTGKQHVWP